MWNRLVTLAAAGALMSAHLVAQTPQPFPRPGQSGPPPQPATPSAPASEPPAAKPGVDDAGAPAANDLVFPVYPAARYLTSYDAGRGQRYYIFGTTTPFADVVTYYRSQLNERGSLVFREPPTHMFEVGRFRDETMAFPPGVTVKDWAWGGSQGYLNPKPVGQPERFPTVIMIVPPPAAGPR